MHHNRDIDAVIAAVLSGQASAEDERILQDWLAENPQNREIFEALAQSTPPEKYLIPSTSADRVYAETQRKLQQKNVNKSQTERWSRLRRYAIAAANAGKFIGFYWLIAAQFAEQNQPTSPALSLVTKKSPIGQKMQIALPDGSLVWLNAGSQIQFYPEFTAESRVVHLQGEAFFSVEWDSLRQFVVLTEQLETTALGTSFNVRAYSDETVTEVALTTGKVAVVVRDSTVAHNSLTLSPGELATSRTDNQSFTKSTFTAGQKTGWKDGIIHFDQADFSQVIRTLERWYGVQIQYNRPPKQHWRFSGEFENDYLSNVLAVIGYTEAFTYRIEQKTVYLNFAEP